MGTYRKFPSYGPHALSNALLDRQYSISLHEAAREWTPRREFPERRQYTVHLWPSPHFSQTAWLSFSLSSRAWECSPAHSLGHVDFSQPLRALLLRHIAWTLLECGCLLFAPHSCVPKPWISWLTHSSRWQSELTFEVLLASPLSRCRFCWEITISAWRQVQVYAESSALSPWDLAGWQLKQNFLICLSCSSQSCSRTCQPLNCCGPITVTQAVVSKVVHVESKNSLHKLPTATLSSLSCLIDGQPCHSFMSSCKKELTILVTCNTILSLGLLSFICKLLLCKFYSYGLWILCLFDTGSVYIYLSVLELT